MSSEEVIFEMEIELDQFENYLDELWISGMSIEEVEDLKEAIEVLKQNNPSISLEEVINKLNIEEE